MAEKKLENKKELKNLKRDIEDLQRYIEEFAAFLPIAICDITPIGKITFINKAFQELTDYREIDISGESAETIFLEKEEIRKILVEVLKKKATKSKELTLISKEKKKIPVSVVCSARQDREGNITGFFLSIIDITESKRLREGLEEKVRERTKKLEESRQALMNMLEDFEEARKNAEEEKNKTLAVITNFADGLLVFDRENRLSLINPQAEDFFKIKTNKIKNKSVSELSKLSNLKPLMNLLGEKIKGIFRKELSIMENLTLEVSTIPLMIEEETIGNLVILHDITRERAIEVMKTEFVSLAAHQLRTPLSAIKWTLRLLLDGDLGKITQEQQEFIQKTYLSNERMISLINALLDVTRIEQGRYLYKPVFAQIENIIQFVINSCKEEIKKRKIKFQFRKPQEKLPEVKVDVEKMRLAIQNLLDNALRYTKPEGEVTIILKHGKKEIEIQIQDTGVGIPKAQQKRVFTKFFRGANVIRMETEGTGLGLFIAQNIIEAHGGKIWFESEEDRGTTFHFTLPIKKEFEEFIKEF